VKIPIYSHIKAKLESKGLDSITSGQIAWFVCSVIIGFTIFTFLFSFSLNSFIDNVDSFIHYLKINTIEFLCLSIFCILIFNTFYIKNILPFLLVVFFIILFFIFARYFDSAIWVVLGILSLCVISVCVIAKKFGFCIIFCIDIALVLCVYQLFFMAGGLRK
ncbi:hypothetical protein, partial [Helicobacter didelphidarum]|uniref:hypothetical protein n=1 Tax=Helicobacter didelphidarum TaxID=2040648 RepID=UPI001FE6AA5E